MNDLLPKNKYYKLCVKAVSGEMSSKEKELLEEWLKISHRNRITYDQIIATWGKMKPLKLPPTPDIGEEWLKLEKSLGIDTQAAKKKVFISVFKNVPVTLSNLLGTRYRAAVFSFATIFILIVGFLIVKEELFRSSFRQIVTLNKQTSQITLSDGSVVHLNSGSSVRFRKTFSDTQREVTLYGEAFFKVTRDERPFLVITENARTAVLGTEFNVWARNEKTRVIVREGSVRLKSITADDGDVLLSQGQMSQITGNRRPQAPKSVDTERLLGWLEGRLVFEKTPLTEILDELERYYDVFIESADSELSHETLTATFNHLPLETVLSSICLTLGAQYRFEDDKYIILNNS